MKNIYFTVACANYVFQNRFNEPSLQFFMIDFPISLGQLINTERHVLMLSSPAHVRTQGYIHIHAYIHLCIYIYIYVYIYPHIPMLFKAHHWITNKKYCLYNTRKNHTFTIIVFSNVSTMLFPLLLCSLWWVQIGGYVLACWSCSFACTLHHLNVIIVQTYLKTLNL